MQQVEALMTIILDYGLVIEHAIRTNLVRWELAHLPVDIYLTANRTFARDYFGWHRPAITDWECMHDPDWIQFECRGRRLLEIIERPLS